MDDHRFDTLTRAFAGGAPRRTFLKTIAGAVFGGAAAAKLASDADAACKPFGRTCAASADCCSGACINGICKCTAGQEKCNSVGVITCVDLCPPGQYRGSACRCLCLTTGRPPVNGSCITCAGDGESCREADCCEGLICNDSGICQPPTCGVQGEECDEGFPCCEGFTCDGTCFPICLGTDAPCSPLGSNSSCCSGCCVIGPQQSGVCASDSGPCIA